MSISTNMYKNLIPLISRCRFFRSGLNRPKNLAGQGTQSLFYHFKATRSTSSGIAAGQGYTIDNKRIGRRRVKEDIRLESKLASTGRGWDTKTPDREKRTRLSQLHQKGTRFYAYNLGKGLFVQIHPLDLVIHAQTKLKTQCDAPRNERRSPTESD